MGSLSLHPGDRFLLKDPHIGPLVHQHGPCPLGSVAKDPLGRLVRSVVGQQLSVKAATTIGSRLSARVGDPVDPSRLARTTRNELRGIGLSRVKAKAIRLIGKGVEEGSIDFQEIQEMDDLMAIRTLTALYGVGPWTAEMFLIFALGRPDILSTGDLGLQEGARRLFGLGERPSPEAFLSLAKPWRPWQSVASWYLWRLLDVPQEGRR